MDLLRFKRFVCHKDVYGRYLCPPLEKELNALSAREANQQDLKIAEILSSAYELNVKAKETLKTLRTISLLAAERNDELLLSMVVREIQRLQNIIV